MTDGARAPVRLPPRLAWAVGASPLVFLVHDVEELATLGRRPPVPEAISGIIPAPTSGAFAGAVVVLFLLQAVATVWLLRHRTRTAALGFAVLACARLVNALAHVGQALAAGAYISGAWTAGLVAGPFGGLLTIAVGRRLDLQPRHWLALFVTAALIQLPIIVIALGVGGWLARLT